MDKKIINNSKVLISLSKKARRNRNMFLYIFLIVFIGGYGLFFTSKSWFPGRDDVIAATKFNITRTWEKREITLDNWVYSKSQRMMEIQIDINNTSYDGIDKYKFTAVDRKKGFLDVQTVVENNDFVVLRIINLKADWSEISLRMNLPGVENSSTYKMYTNKYDVSAVSNIEDKTENQYLLAKLQNMIDSYTEQIKDLSKQIEDTQKVINNCNSDIEALKAKKKYQTDEEKKDTDQMISDANTKISSLSAEITENNSDVLEYKARIEKTKEQMKQYQ